ncbi:MAG: hypothetical protein FWE70_01670 [Oscillospiraceae bacterium]|nr:hypothetical protein [Oscillospiraceae bacterium]
MENIVREMIKIEGLAREMASEAERDRKAQPEVLASVASEMGGRMERELRERLEAVRAESVREADERVAAIEAECAARLEGLRREYAAARDALAESLFLSVIRGKAAG